MTYVDQPPPQAPYPPGPGGPPPKSSSTATIFIVLAVVGIAVVVLVGVLAAIGIYGARSYMVKAKASEGLNGAGALARGIAACGEKESGKLPETSVAVPSTPPAGINYMSTPSDWNDPAFKCAYFDMSTPQYFSYQWVKESDTRGRVVALADLDADGTAEQRVEVVVECAGSTCTAQRATGP
ncbi:MAG: hypothetical protein R3B07_25810 [Polyangiaceae bacterium]